MRRYVAAGLAAAVVALAAVVLLPSLTGSASCSPQRGGRAGAETQLRFIDVGERQATFTFGASSASNVFDVPAFVLERRPDDAGGAGQLIIRFDGASANNPDGSQSYSGRSVIDGGAGAIRSVALVEDQGRSTQWSIALGRGGCPLVATKTYVYGKNPRAQVSVMFGTATSVAFEHSSVSSIGSPAGSPVLLSGFGFAPSAPVYVRIGADTIWDSHANADGTLDTGFVPLRPPGEYEIVVSDDRGHSASTHLRITAER